MGDRTKIADALSGMIGWPEGNVDDGAIDAVLDALDAAGYDVVLRADPDTSDDTSRKGVLRHTFHDDGTMTAEVLTAPDTSDDQIVGEAADRKAVGAVQSDASPDPVSVSTSPTTSDDLFTEVAAERDAERAARERAEAEARQLRERVAWIVPNDGPMADHDTYPWKLVGPNGGQIGGPYSDGYLTNVGYDPASLAAAVAEGAEDRGQTDG